MIPEPLHSRLIAWGRWNRGGYLPAEFWVGCESAEHNYSEGQAGDVFEATTDRLTAALKDGSAGLSDADAMEIEVALLQLPRRAALALRLHYVGYPRITPNQRRRILGVSIDKYHELLDNSAGALASLLMLQRPS